MEQNAKPVTMYTLGKLAYISRKIQRKHQRDMKQESNSICARHLHETGHDYDLKILWIKENLGKRPTVRHIWKVLHMQSQQGLKCPASKKKKNRIVFRILVFSWSSVVGRVSKTRFYSVSRAVSSGVHGDQKSPNREMSSPRKMISSASTDLLSVWNVASFLHLTDNYFFLDCCARPKQIAEIRLGLENWRGCWNFFIKFTAPWMYQHFLPQISATFDELQTIILEEIATIDRNSYARGLPYIHTEQMYCLWRRSPHLISKIQYIRRLYLYWILE